MPVVRLAVDICAPIDICFDCARDIDLHILSTAGTNERAVAGRTTGLIELGEEVTWEATHLFIRQRLRSRITIFEPPHWFRDTQVRGAFRRFDHDHTFSKVDANMTRMSDVFDYASPLGWIGRLADALFLKRYMEVRLERRSLVVKEAAERMARDQGGY